MNAPLTDVLAVTESAGPVLQAAISASPSRFSTRVSGVAAGCEKKNFWTVRPPTVAESPAVVADLTVPRLDSRMSAPVRALGDTSEESTAFLAIRERVTLRALMFAVRTALDLSCLEPTLLAGSLVTAYVVPPIATNSATTATIIAGDGR